MKNKTSLILITLLFAFFSTEAQVDKKSKKAEQLDEVEVKGKLKKRRTLRYSKVAKIKNKMYAFGSQVVDGKLYVVGGDMSVKVNKSKLALEKKIGLDHEFSTKEFYKLLRRVNGSSHKYSDDLQVFDLDSDEWVSLNEKVKLGNRAYHNVHSYKDELYILGGKRLSKNKRYDYLNDRIEILKLDSLKVLTDYTNPHQAINFASTVYKNYLIVMGGSSKKNHKTKVEYSNQSHFYDFSTGLWYELPKMPVRKEGSGILVGSKFYLIGGFNGKELENVESFDFKDGKWRKERSLSNKIRMPGLAVKGKNIFIFNEGKVLIYDTKNNQINQYYINLNIKGADLHFYNEALYIVGGYRETENIKEPYGNIYKVKLEEFNKTNYIKL